MLTAESGRKIQDLLDKVLEENDKKGLTFNCKKTEGEWSYKYQEGAEVQIYGKLFKRKLKDEKGAEERENIP